MPSTPASQRQTRSTTEHRACLGVRSQDGACHTKPRAFICFTPCSRTNAHTAYRIGKCFEKHDFIIRRAKGRGHWLHSHHRLTFEIFCAFRILYDVCYFGMPHWSQLLLSDGLGCNQSLLKDGPNVCNIVNGESIFQDRGENREAIHCHFPQALWLRNSNRADLAILIRCWYICP